jgi:hypothetical protein
MIYISGAMSGIKDFNYPEFNRVAKYLREAGYKVFNPAEITLDKTGMSKDEIYEAYMTICLKAIEKCDIIYLLNGWNLSSGAKRELKKAIELDLKVYLQGDFV